MKQYLIDVRDGLLAGRYNAAIIALVFAFVLIGVPQEALAQVVDPFGKARSATTSIMGNLQTFALTVGGIGMVSCLLLGFFGKLNWKWVATGIGVSFAIAIVPGTINWLGNLGGMGNS